MCKEKRFSKSDTILAIVCTNRYRINPNAKLQTFCEANDSGDDVNGKYYIIFCLTCSLKILSVPGPSSDTKDLNKQLIRPSYAYSDEAVHCCCMVGSTFGKSRFNLKN
jgi:hypothetical protein